MITGSELGQNTTMMATEYFFSFSVTFSGWIIAASLWFRSGAVLPLFDQFRHLRTDVASIWPWVSKALISALPFGLDAALFSVWYVEYFALNWSRPWAYVYVASFLWLMMVGTVPVVWYILLAHLVLDSLCANNTALIRAVAAAAECDQRKNLARIYVKNLTLRRLYGDMEHVLSIALLCSKLIITSTLICNVSYIVFQMMTETWINFTYVTIIPMFLNLVTIVIMGHTADSITKAVRLT